MAKAAADKGNKTLILSDRTKLMGQNAEAFKKFGLNPTYINPQVKTVPMESNATSGMLQTLRRRIDKPEVQEFLKTRDLIIIDEAHVGLGDYLFESGLIDHIPVIGATATPRRVGGQAQLGNFYDEIVNGEQVKYFIENGWLNMDRYFGIDAGDVSNIPYDYKTGDYHSQGMYKHFDKREKYQGVIDNYMTHAPNTKGICFCSSQSHAVKTAVEFEKAGIKTMFLVSGKNEPKKPTEWKDEAERIKYEQDVEDWKYINQYKYLTGKYSDVIESFENNEFKMIVNVNQLSTGIDIPDIESVILNRYTISLPFFLQSQGRGSRLSPETGKIHFNLFDFGNAACRTENNLGRYADDRDWGLWHETSKGGGIAGSKLCDKNKEDKNKRRGCNRLNHIGAKMCRCGFIFATEKELKEAELIEIAYGDAVPEDVLVATMNVLQLQAHAKLKKYKIGWIARILHSRGGKDEVYRGLKELGYKHYYIREYVLKYIK